MERVAGAPLVLVLLDFDGTLAPYQTEPKAALIPDPAREWLVEIARSPRVTVGIVSGRRLKDLIQRVGLEGIVYAGNHGIEVRGRGLHFLEPFAFLLEPALKEVLSELTTRLGGLPHVWIEDKVLTGTVHVMGAEAAPIAQAAEIIASIMRVTPSFRCLAGRHSFDILPQNGWTKGTAAQWIQHGLGMDEALVIYAGDDVSDEEAFSGLPGAITIKVGSEPTEASYRAESPVEVWALLAKLAGILSQPRTLDWPTADSDPSGCAVPCAASSAAPAFGQPRGQRDQANPETRTTSSITESRPAFCLH